MFTTSIALAAQAPAHAATDPAALQPYLQYGMGGIVLAALAIIGWLVKSAATTSKENVETIKAIAKDSADRAERQSNDCNARNEKNTAIVAAACDRFGEAQETTTKLFTDTVHALQLQQAKQQEAHNALVREINAAKERGEERLHEALRTLQELKAG